MEDTTTKAIVNLNDAARMNRETGMLLATKEQLVTAIQDRRVHRGHLRLLAGIATFMNNGTGKAWPGRAALAALLGTTVKTISNDLTELREFGYVISEREPVPEANNRVLQVYTWGSIDHVTIRREIESYVQGVRDGKIPGPGRHHSDVPPPGGSPLPGGTNIPPPGGTSVPLPGGTVATSSPSRGLRVPPIGGAVTHKKELEKKRANSSEYWHRQLNPGTPDYSVADNGVVTITGGARVSWLEKFGGDEEALNLALAQISQWVQPNSGRPLSIQVEAQLSKVVLDRRDKDRRYNSRVAANPGPSNDGKARRERMRIASEEVLAQQAARKGRQRT